VAIEEAFLRIRGVRQGLADFGKRKPEGRQKMTVEEYRKLRTRRTQIMYAHCGNCLKDKPDGLPPSEWKDLEAIMDLKTGVITVGCVRCEMPIVDAVLDPELVKELTDWTVNSVRRSNGTN